MALPETHKEYARPWTAMLKVTFNWVKTNAINVKNAHQDKTLLAMNASLLHQLQDQLVTAVKLSTWWQTLVIVVEEAWLPWVAHADSIQVMAATPVDIKLQDQHANVMKLTMAGLILASNVLQDKSTRVEFANLPRWTAMQRIKYN